MAYCVICGDIIKKECVNISKDSVEKYNLEKVCTWCSLDVMQGKISPPEKTTD